MAQIKKNVLTTTIQATSSTGKTIRTNADNTMPYNTNKHSSNGFMGKGKRNTQNSWPSHCLGKIIGLHWPLCEPRSAPSSVSGQSFLQPVGTICLETVHTQAGRNGFIYHSLTELDDGKIYRKPWLKKKHIFNVKTMVKPLYFMIKTMVSGEDCPSKTNPLIHLSNDPSMNHMGG